MQVVGIAIALIIVFVGILFNQSNKGKLRIDKEDTSEEVLSESKIETSTTSEEIHNASESEDQDIIEEAEPTLLPTNTPVPTKIFLSSLSGYIYPNSTVINRTDSSLIIESTDSDETITNWYEQKIKSEGINVRSFIKTKTNGNVNNKLVGAKQEETIEVKIEKKTNEVITNVEIEMSK